MRTLFATLLLALGLVALLPPGAAQAQECLDSSGEFYVTCTSISSDSGSPGIGPGLNSGSTRTIVRILQGADATCGSELIEKRYRIDCLRLYYLKVADALPDSGDYLPIKTAMLDAAAKLDAIVEANLDERTPPIRPREGHKPAAKRLPVVRPVQEDMADIALAQAAEVVKETELIIIRSGGDPARRTEHYTDIAAAVEDNLVILRSA